MTILRPTDRRRETCQTKDRKKIKIRKREC